MGAMIFKVPLHWGHCSMSISNTRLSNRGPDGRRRGEGRTPEDRINRIMEARKMLPNASYFAFTATPKNKTLEIFGEPDPQPDGTVKHRPFHSYTMKQAIQEGFIVDRQLMRWLRANRYDFKSAEELDADVRSGHRTRFLRCLVRCRAYGSAHTWR